MLPQPDAETLPRALRRQLLPSALLPARVRAATSSPVGPGGFRASCTLGPMLCIALVPSLPGPPVGRPFCDGAGGIRTHGLELMRLARTTAPLPRYATTGLAGWSRTSDLRFPKPAEWPSSPTTRARGDAQPPLGSTPGGTRTRSFRVEGPASSPFDHGGLQKLRRQGSNLRLAINSRASCRSTTPERNGGSRIRTCGRGGRLRVSNALPSAARPCLQERKGRESNPQGR